MSKHEIRTLSSSPNYSSHWLAICCAVPIFFFFVFSLCFLKTTNHCLLSLKIMVSLMLCVVCLVPTVFPFPHTKAGTCRPPHDWRLDHALRLMFTATYMASETSWFRSKDNHVERQGRHDLPVFLLLHTVLMLFFPALNFLELIFSFKSGVCLFLCKVDRDRSFWNWKQHTEGRD